MLSYRNITKQCNSSSKRTLQAEAHPQNATVFIERWAPTKSSISGASEYFRQHPTPVSYQRQNQPDSHLLWTTTRRSAKQHGRFMRTIRSCATSAMPARTWSLFSRSILCARMRLCLESSLESSSSPKLVTLSEHWVLKWSRDANVSWQEEDYSNEISPDLRQELSLLHEMI